MFYEEKNSTFSSVITNPVIFLKYVLFDEQSTVPVFFMQKTKMSPTVSFKTIEFIMTRYTLTKVVSFTDVDGAEITRWIFLQDDVYTRHRIPI